MTNQDGKDNSMLSPSKAGFRLKLGLKEAHDLIAMDRCGTSDPYVKVKLDHQTVYRTKTIMKELDPVWNETCEVVLEHLGQKIKLAMYDYDRGSISDDFLGQVEVDILKLELQKTVELKLPLTLKPSDINKGRTSYRGYIMITAHLENVAEGENIKPTKSNFIKVLSFDKQEWCHVLEIVVAQVRQVKTPKFSSESGLSEFCLKIGYGSEWVKTKTVSFDDGNEATPNDEPGVVPIGEQFSFTIKYLPLDDLVVEMNENGDLAGSFTVDLKSLAIEQTHKIERRLSDNCGVVLLTATITGTRPDVIASGETALPVPSWTPGGPPLINPDFFKADEGTWLTKLGNAFSLANSSNLGEGYVGVLVLKIIQARNLISSDVGGKSDPFCTIEIINVRLRTHTEHKTLNPKWNRTYIIPIDDIHSFVTISVFDDDRNSKPDFLGKIMVPVLFLHDMQGQRDWFVLKNVKLSEGTTERGAVELEAFLFYNKPRAILRALDPKERSYLAKEEKISIKQLQRDIQRGRKLLDKCLKFRDKFIDLMSWTHPPTTMTAIAAWVSTCFIFEPWMAPFALAMFFVCTFFFGATVMKKAAEDDGDNENEDTSKFSLSEKLNRLQEICLNLQQNVEMVTMLYERLKSIILWRTPWVSAAAMTLLFLLAFVCYIVPMRWLLMTAGVYELAKKKIRPEAGFEVYDLVSRAYTERDIVRYFSQDTIPAFRFKKEKLIKPA